LGAAPESVGSRKRAARIGPYLVGAVGSQPASFLNQDVTARRNGLYVPIVVGEFDGAARLDRSAAEAGVPSYSRGPVGRRPSAGRRQDNHADQRKGDCK